MARNKTKRLRPAVLQADLEAYAALLAITGYTPPNPDFRLDTVTTQKSAMEADQTDEIQKQAAAEAAADKAIASQWKFHDLILGVKNQVKAQFGEDSDEFASLGLKKKSEYRTGRRPAKPPANPAP